MHKILGRGVTTNFQLDNLGHKLFNNRYKGTYSSDQIMRLHTDTCKGSAYAIINNKTAAQGGEHWIAIAHTPRKFYVFDSYGRSTKSLIPSVFKRLAAHGEVIDSDYDRNQTSAQTDCGARCMSFLKVFDDHGARAAMKI